VLAIIAACSDYLQLSDGGAEGFSQTKVFEKIRRIGADGGGKKPKRSQNCS
jgi:hypothetical protein